MNSKIKSISSHTLTFALGVLLSASGVIAATILSGTEVSYTGNKVNGASNIQQAIDNLYTTATTSSSECRTGYQKQIENGAEYTCGRIARQCSGNNCTVCIRAERLHTEICNQTSSNCNSAGYSLGSVITYGNETTTNGVLNTGDAFDCDVNGDGTYDSNTERFYYVSTKTNGITTDSNTAVLIYSNNTINGEPSNGVSYWGIRDVYNGPETARSNLPTTSQWSNVQLTQTVRDITKEDNTIRISNFSYEGYSTRLLTYQEVNAGCYDGTTAVKTAGGINSKCKFLMENTRFSNANNPTVGGWLETPYCTRTFCPWYVDSIQNRVIDGGNDFGTNGSMGARPAIEVQLSEIEY